MPNYHVTEDGKVFRENGVELTQWKSNTGYMKVRFYGKKNRDMYVHRLVAEKYVPNPNNLPIVKHKDDNKLNNHASNLEWVLILRMLKRVMRTGATSSTSVHMP